MFESRTRLAAEIKELLEAIREMAGASYACLLEPSGIVFETPALQGREVAILRRFLEERSRALFELPKAMASGESMEDLFAGRDSDEFFFAYLNGRVALALACEEAESLKETLQRPLRALADRLFRYNESYRLDPQGRGFLFGRPRLDMVVVGRASAEEA